ncbi:MAG: circularly permuted type 2 ATP-grasp protein [Myxococcota bacterium]
MNTTSRSAAAPGARLSYDPEGGFDLMRAGATGPTREGWEQVEAFLATISPEELAARHSQAQDHIRRNGVTYNEFADPQMAHGPWNVDPIPLVISTKTWEALELGLEQRARLLDALLRDLYGPQRVLTERLLPPELVFGNPGFSRPCHQLLPNASPMLFMHAAEVAWDGSGAPYVLSDGTQAPAGTAYALENRLVVSQLLSREFRSQRVRRLAPFFDGYRRTLRSLPRYARENPFIAVLTPGPYTESYFEHAYLASYLGLTLVQGADLAVRDSRVFLKTLGGLERVDVILRRVNDLDCDPLDLNGRSALGVAGLTQAVRAGNVAVSNALGTGVLQTRAFLGYLPSICVALLGEDLRLPSAETYWCGEESARELVLDQLSEMVVGPTFQEDRNRVAAGTLSKSGLEELRARIRANPGGYVAQRDVGLATAPSWVNGSVVPRPVVLRTFAARQNRGHQVMPGGLARVAPSASGRSQTGMQSGTTSKDCWVLTDGPINPMSLLRKASAGPLEISRAGGDLPSRIADDLFWLGRYVERADETARLLRVMATNLTDNSVSGGAAVLPVLVKALAAHTESETNLEPPDADDIEPLERELVRFLLSRSTPRSLRNVLGNARRLAFAARDRISHDALRALQGAVETFEGPELSDDITLGEALELLNSVLLSLAAFSGMGFDGLTRGAGYRFADMGRRVERAYGTARLLAATLSERDDEDEDPLLLAMLYLLDSTGAYRRRYRGALDAAAVLDLLICDERNPRSIAFQLAAINEHLGELPGDDARDHRSPESRIVLRALTRLRLAEIRALSVMGDDGVRSGLRGLLEETSQEMGVLSNSLTTSYFAHAVATLSLSRSEEGGTP